VAAAEPVAEPAEAATELNSEAEAEA